LLLGHEELASGACRRPGCQTVGLEDDLETQALALIVELSLAHGSVDDMAGMAQRFLEVHGLVV
jgi:hypothetical protein